jgi:tetratricopeptide (TPR) repeat protein
MVVLFFLFTSWLGAERRSATYNREAVSKLEAFDFNGAVTDFQAAVALDPDSLVVRVNLGLAHFYVGDFAQACQQLRSVLNKEPREPYAKFLYGVIADREGRTEEAISYFQSVLELAPGDPGTYYHLGLIALREEKSEQAVELFERSLAGDPGCTSSLYNLGRALVSSGKRDEGEAVLEKFQALQSQKKPGLGGGMGDPSLLVGKYGQPRRLPEE